MPQELYALDQVAELLGLHVRTIRGYVREGRLTGVRIGKQYRVGREDLEAFMGRPVTQPDPVRRQRYTEVSSIVQIDAIGRESAERLGKTVLAAVRGERPGDQPLRVDTVYDEERARLKVIVTGGLATTVGLLRLIGAVTEAEA